MTPDIADDANRHRDRRARTDATAMPTGDDVPTRVRVPRARAGLPERRAHRDRRVARSRSRLRAARARRASAASSAARTRAPSARRDARDRAAHAAAQRRLARASAGSPSARPSRPRTLEEQRLPKIEGARRLLVRRALVQRVRDGRDPARAGRRRDGALTHSIADRAGDRRCCWRSSRSRTGRRSAPIPSGGGAYIVARENLGDVAGLTAAAALSVDYILTVAVSIAAGVFAITSAFPELRPLQRRDRGRRGRHRSRC